jgi:hypothetical protein
MFGINGQSSGTRRVVLPLIFSALVAVGSVSPALATRYGPAGGYASFQATTSYHAIQIRIDMTMDNVSTPQDMAARVRLYTPSGFWTAWSQWQSDRTLQVFGVSGANLVFKFSYNAIPPGQYYVQAEYAWYNSGWRYAPVEGLWVTVP